MVPAIYTALATAMFFLQDAYFSIGGMELSLKNPCALGIVFLALLNFIATVRLGRFMLLVRHALVQALPFLPWCFPPPSGCPPGRTARRWSTAWA